MLVQSKRLMGAALLALAATAIAGPATAGAAVGGGLSFSPQTGNVFDFGTVGAGQTPTQVFTLTSVSRGLRPGRVHVRLFGARTFSVVADSCTGVVLTPAQPSCQVTVRYAPGSKGRRTASGLIATAGPWWRRWGRGSVTGIRITGTSGPAGGGQGSGPASLTLTPGTPTGTASGVNS